MSVMPSSMLKRPKPRPAVPIRKGGRVKTDAIVLDGYENFVSGGFYFHGDGVGLGVLDDVGEEFPRMAEEQCRLIVGDGEALRSPLYGRPVRRRSRAGASFRSANP
jgi:hypothetical protein